MAETNLGEKPKCSSKEKKNAGFRSFVGYFTACSNISPHVTTHTEGWAKSRNLPDRWATAAAQM